MSALSPPSSPPPPSTASSRSSRLSLAFDFSPPKGSHTTSSDKAGWRFLSFGRGKVVPNEDPAALEERDGSLTTTTMAKTEQDEDEPEEWERRQRERVARRERRKARALLGAVHESPAPAPQSALSPSPPVPQFPTAPPQNLARFRIDPSVSDRFSEFLQRGPPPAPVSPPTPRPMPAPTSPTAFHRHPDGDWRREPSPAPFSPPKLTVTSPRRRDSKTADQDQLPDSSQGSPPFKAIPESPPGSEQFFEAHEEAIQPPPTTKSPTPPSPLQRTIEHDDYAPATDGERRALTNDTPLSPNSVLAFFNSSVPTPDSPPLSPRTRTALALATSFTLFPAPEKDDFRADTPRPSEDQEADLREPLFHEEAGVFLPLRPKQMLSDDERAWVAETRVVPNKGRRASRTGVAIGLAGSWGHQILSPVPAETEPPESVRESSIASPTPRAPSPSTSIRSFDARYSPHSPLSTVVRSPSRSSSVLSPTRSPLASPPKPQAISSPTPLGSGALRLDSFSQPTQDSNPTLFPGLDEMSHDPAPLRVGMKSIRDAANQRSLDTPTPDVRQAKLAGVVQRMRKTSVPPPVLSLEQKNELRALRASGKSPELGLLHEETKYGARDLKWKQAQVYSNEKRKLEERLYHTPDDWRVLNDLAALYVVQPFEQVRREAEQCWIQSLALEKRQPTVWSKLGRIRMHNADALGASQAFQRAVDYDPKSARYWLDLGLSQLGSLLSPVHALEEAARLAPRTNVAVEALFQLGRHAERKQDGWADAWEYYRKAVDVARDADPSDLDVPLRSAGELKRAMEGAVRRGQEENTPAPKARSIADGFRPPSSPPAARYPAQSTAATKSPPRFASPLRAHKSDCIQPSLGMVAAVLAVEPPDYRSPRAPSPMRDSAVQTELRRRASLRNVDVQTSPRLGLLNAVGLNLSRTQPQRPVSANGTRHSRQSSNYGTAPTSATSIKSPPSGDDAVRLLKAQVSLNDAASRASTSAHIADLFSTMAQALRDSTVAEQKRQEEIVEALMRFSSELSTLSQRLVATAALMKNRPPGVEGPGATSDEYDVRGLMRLREKIEREAAGGSRRVPQA